MRPAELFPCAGCGFDPDRYRGPDVVGTLRSFAPRWRETLDGVGAGRPALRDHLEALGVQVQPGSALAEDLGAMAMAIEARILQGGDLIGELHPGLHHLARAGRAVAAELRAAGVGTVVSVNVSGGGLPKAAVDGAAVGYRGLAGDRQATRRHHGRPWQAVCLWSGEVIDDLVAEGHGLVPGAAGENLTVRGLSWARMRPGLRLRAGTALLELTAFAVPCRQLRSLFEGEQVRRIDHARRPGSARIYAAVLETGYVQVGDPVVVEPGRAEVCAPAAHGETTAAPTREAGHGGRRPHEPEMRRLR